ncbi:urea ABC transporter permease subunit UrtB [Pseudocolwellia sp. AS88]|uniref:urea ABC transporter permease subunit UrtB n=1 Tax=Pseudocolwellia sp. AS88 TaxID=3063958 RepID=UPI0026EAE14A|nr:urea ABC transporter permease subunit UrtB [Pseudocolwellia sp. AS88]MDO7084919.1 urea ABC transporter permease subunit UrtB [Pseudocolwellia sp. AS88]
MLRIFLLLICCFLAGQSVASEVTAKVNDNEVVSAEVTIAEPQSNEQAQLIALFKKLPTTKLSKMPLLIEQLSQTKAPQIKKTFNSLMNGDLYYLKSNKQIVHAQLNADNKYALTDVLTNTKLEAVAKSKIRKVKTNNRLRGKIRSLLAQLDLTFSDKTVRIEAVKQILDKPNDIGIETIKKLINSEQDDDVRELMSVTLLVQQLLEGEHTEKLAAVKQLKTSLEPSVLNAMATELSKVEKPASPEDKALKVALEKAMADIDGRKGLFEFAENLFFGISLGSVLLLAAIGLAITFGVMGVINMAHGEMMMLGAYTTYVIQQAFPQLIEYSLLMAIPAAFLVSGLVGVAIERGVIRHLKGRPLETLLATFGISLILQQLVRTIFSPLNRQVLAPEWMSGSWQINPIFSLTFNRLYIIIFSLMVFVALLMILKKTSLGLHVRAVSQNRDMARALSIKSDWVDAITFGLGSGIAGIAGVVLSQLTNVGPNLGQAYIIDSFLVVVFGGVGNLWGTLVAAMSLGAFNKFLEPVTGSVLANIIVLVGLVLFIQKKPKGLFPQKGRSAD